MQTAVTQLTNITAAQLVRTRAGSDVLHFISLRCILMLQMNFMPCQVCLPHSLWRFQGARSSREGEHADDFSHHQGRFPSEAAAYPGGQERHRRQEGETGRLNFQFILKSRPRLLSHIFTHLSESSIMGLTFVLSLWCTATE